MADLASDDLDRGGRLVTDQQDPHGCSPDERYDGTLGRCVKKDMVEKWSPDEEMAKLVQEVEKRAYNKNRMKQEPKVGIGTLGNRQVDDREDPDPFLEDELALALAMSRSAFALAEDEILPLYDDQVLPDDPARFSQVRLDDANDQAASIWEKLAWGTALAAAASTAISRSFGSGESSISPGIARTAPTVQRVMDNMVAVAQWNTNQFFNQQVMPALQKRVDDLFTTGAFDQADITPIRGILDRRLRSVPYWRVVANAATSRSYHYGVLKAAQFQGFRGYRFVAVLDDRTSDICRTINGREWFIADAVNKFEQVAGSEDPDEVKRVFPWVSVNDVGGQTSDALRDLGVMVPPLHGNCRSTIRPIF